MGFYHLVNLVEDTVCHRLQARGSRLRDICRHDNGIQTTLIHLMQIDLQALVAAEEIDTLREEHGSVAVAVESHQTFVNLTDLTIAGSLLNQPLKDGQSVGKPLGMPLHAQDGLKLGTLHRLDNAILGFCHHAELIACFANGLMVEGIDIEQLL